MVTPEARLTGLEENETEKEESQVTASAKTPRK